MRSEQGWNTPPAGGRKPGLRAQPPSLTGRFLARREAFAGTIQDVAGGIAMLSFLVAALMWGMAL